MDVWQVTLTTWLPRRHAVGCLVARKKGTWSQGWFQGPPIMGPPYGKLPILFPLMKSTFFFLFLPFAIFSSFHSGHWNHWSDSGTTSAIKITRVFLGDFPRANGSKNLPETPAIEFLEKLPVLKKSPEVFRLRCKVSISMDETKSWELDVIGGSCGEKKISSRLEKNHGLFFRPHKVWGPKCRYFSMAKKLGVAEGVCCHLIIFSSCFLSLSTLLRWLVGRPQTCGPVAQAHHVWSAVHQWEADIHETVLIRNGLPDDHVHFALRLSSFLWRLWCWNLKRQDLLGPFHHFVWSFHEELDD